MNKFFRHSLILVLMSGFVFLNACKDDEPPLPENFTAFESDQLGISSAEAELTVNLSLVREAEVDGTVSIAIESTGVTYGTDFTTDPAATANVITVAVPAGATSASFKIIKAEGLVLDGDESIKFTIQSLAETLEIGEKKELKVSFAEILASKGTMEINGGGPSAPNKVFIDLSANRQVAVPRSTWDLGFSNDSEFHVILNSSNGMMARAIDKTDLNTVTAADTLGFGAQLNLSAIFALASEADDPSTLPDWLKNTSITWIDNPAGDLSKTAIAAVSATASENKVYIVNRGNNSAASGWKKIRVIRNGSNYTLQHADIAATTFSEVQVSKDAKYNFQYVSFTSGVVNVDPEKEKWDIAWTGYTNTTNFGPGTPTFPYYFQDLVIQNAFGVETFTYTTNTTNTLTYDTFAEANLAGLTWSKSQINIGSSWRTTGGPPPSPPAGVNATRFYLIKDSDGNYYKLKFTSLTANSERGKPQFEFTLLKKGA